MPGDGVHAVWDFSRHVHNGKVELTSQNLGNTHRQSDDRIAAAHDEWRQRHGRDEQGKLALWQSLLLEQFVHVVVAPQHVDRADEPHLRKVRQPELSAGEG